MMGGKGVVGGGGGVAPRLSRMIPKRLVLAADGRVARPKCLSVSDQADNVNTDTVAVLAGHNRQ
jgi:hypothetical protein